MIEKMYELGRGAGFICLTVWYGIVGVSMPKLLQMSYEYYFGAILPPFEYYIVSFAGIVWTVYSIDKVKRDLNND